MVELAEIFRRHAPDFLRRHKVLPLQRRAIDDISRCRTETLGGHVYLCPTCGRREYRYRSCKNRHCPKCQHDEAQQWFAAQSRLLLPTDCFLATFTLPKPLCALAYAHQRRVYGLLFQAAAAATTAHQLVTPFTKTLLRTVATPR